MNNEISLRTSVRRQNRLKKAVYDFALNNWSYCRLLLEVFIRKNFGINYFSLGVSLWTTIVLVAMPSIFKKISESIDKFLGLFGQDYAATTLDSFYTKYITWYIFAGLFLIFSIIRKIEIKKKGFTPDFRTPADYAGDFWIVFFRLPIITNPSVRTVETLIEPGAFMLLGIVLKFLGQPLGLLLIICSIMYGLSYAAQYNQGDQKLYYINDKAVENIDVNQKLYEGYFTRSEGVHNNRDSNNVYNNSYPQNNNHSSGENDEEPPHILKV